MKIRHPMGLRHPVADMIITVGGKEVSLRESRSGFEFVSGPLGNNIMGRGFVPWMYFHGTNFTQPS